MAAVTHHGPCPDCGSRDNLAHYDDGGEHCFTPGCGRHRSGGDPEDQARGSSAPTLFEAHDVEAVEGRRLTIETCRRYGYAKVTYQGRRYQAAPYCDQTGRPVAWKLRSPEKHFQWVGDRTRMLPLFGQHLQSGGKRIVVTEGEVDALSVSQALGNRWSVVSLPDGAGSWRQAFSRAVGWLDSFERIVLCFDMDEAGRAAAEEAAEFLPAGKVAIANLPRKDPNEMLVAGEAAQLRDALWSAPTWAPAGIVTGAQWLEVLKGRYQPPVAHFPFPVLDAMTRGMRSGEIILMVGASGGGKSTWCRSTVWGLVQAGVRVGVLSLEETLPVFMTPLVGFAMGRNLRMVDGDPTEIEGFAEALAGIEDLVVGYDDPGERDPDRIFDRARYMHTALGCRVIVLDHLTVILAAGAEDGVAGADRLMARLEAFVKKSGIALLVVMHLRKAGGNGPSFEQGKVPTMSDIRGSGLIAAFAHTIVARSRDQEENDGGRLHLLKCRLGGTGRLGEADELLFDESTGMLVSKSDPVAVLSPVGQGEY